MSIGLLGLAAMLWLYGVAGLQPMAESIDWMGSAVSKAVRWPSATSGTLVLDGGRIGAAPNRIVTLPKAAPSKPAAITSVPETVSVDPDVTALIAERRAKANAVQGEGVRM